MSVDDYADRVTVRIAFVPYPGQEEDDESWDLVFYPQLGFNQREFRNELLSLGTLGSGDGCGGHGRAILDERHSTYEWGAASEVFDFYLTLPDEVKGAIVGQALTSLCGRVGNRIKERRAGGLVFTLDEEVAVEAAKAAVLRRLGSGTDAALVVQSVEDLGDDTFGVEIVLKKGRTKFDVSVRQDGTGSQLARVRKVSDPD